jgi:hypothetical protein
MFDDQNEWEAFYNKVKGADYPECQSEDDFLFLPDWIKEELITNGYDPVSSNFEKFITSGKNGINVFYTNELNGGGTWIGTEFIDIIKDLYPNRVFDNAYEWCAGCGFIAFNLLDHGIANNICLTDIYYPAIDCVERTANSKLNNCRDQVKSYILKDLSLLPKNHMFDLVVASPPTFPEYQFGVDNRIYADLNWNGRRHFFKHIKEHLTPDGVILMHESYKASKPETFLQMLEDSGLEIKSVIRSKKYFTFDLQIYFLEIVHKQLDNS